MVRNIIGSLTPIACFAPTDADSAATTASNSPQNISLTVVFDNMSADSSLTPAGGFSCLISGYGGTILFDTGANGEILLSNMKKMGLDPMDVDLVVLSHEHDDHASGLKTFLDINPRVEVVLPESSSEKVRSVADTARKVSRVKEAGRVVDGVSTTGEMGVKIIEQSLVLATPRGLVVLTGCAHAGVGEIAARAAERFGGQLHLVAGGFHLEQASAEDIECIINRLKELGVEKVGSTHCTGEKALEAFREGWGAEFVEFHLGSKLEIGAE